MTDKEERWKGETQTMGYEYYFVSRSTNIRAETLNLTADTPVVPPPPARDVLYADYKEGKGQDLLDLWQGITSQREILASLSQYRSDVDFQLIQCRKRAVPKSGWAWSAPTGCDGMKKSLLILKVYLRRAYLTISGEW